MKKSAKKPPRIETRGRKPLPPGEVRAVKLSRVRLSEKELDQIKAAAEAEGVELSRWVRGRLGLG